MSTLPYKIATLCDLRDERGRILLLRRLKAPNQGLCSPIGGKLDMAEGESPAECARREIWEEAGLEVPLERLHLTGLIAEQAYEGKGHWLLFYFRVLGAVSVQEREMAEGRLEWHEPGAIEALPLPDTDRRIIWPLVREAERGWSEELHAKQGVKPGFFSVHIDCRTPEMKWRVHQQTRAV